MKVILTSRDKLISDMIERYIRHHRDGKQSLCSLGSLNLAKRYPAPLGAGNSATFLFSGFEHVATISRTSDRKKGMGCSAPANERRSIKEQGSGKEDQ
jgi:hypothetical protein